LGRFLGSFYLLSAVLEETQAVLDGNPSEIQARLKVATGLSGRRSGMLRRIEYET
jgi:hypothetical protein